MTPEQLPEAPPPPSPTPPEPSSGTSAASKVFRGTDIAAGGFALVGALQAVFLPLLLLLGTLARAGRPQVGPPPAEPNRGAWLLYPMAMLLFVSAVFLFVGAIVLFVRGKNGRALTVAGATTSIVVQLMPATFGLGREGEALRALPVTITYLVPAMVALALALVPQMSNWIAARPR
jgi:hypothetical protein